MYVTILYALYTHSQLGEELVPILISIQSLNSKFEFQTQT